MWKAVFIFVLSLYGCRPWHQDTPPPQPAVVIPELETSVTQVTFSTNGEDRDPEVSPDGSTVFFASSAHGASLDVYSKAVDGTTVTRLIASDGDDRFPRLNPLRPDILAFCSNYTGPWRVYTVDLKASPAVWEPISESGSEAILPSWSPDGTKVVYCATPTLEENDWTIKIYDFGIGRTHIVEDIRGIFPRWSPVLGDNRIVFQKMRERDRWFSTLWTFRFDGSRAMDLTEIIGSAEWAAINPNWSPDGRRIVFASVAKSRGRQDVLSEADDLWVIRADGTHLIQLTTNTAADWMPVWSSDNRIFFTSTRRGRATLWSLSPRFPSFQN